MDLLNEKHARNGKNEEKKKKVLILLVVSVILAILIIILINILKNLKPATLTYSVELDDSKITMADNFIIQYQDQDKYINLKTITTAAGYSYYNGKYMSYTEDKNKCYINNQKEVIGFDVGSTKIYKTYKIDSNVENDSDYEYYTLNKNVILYNDEIFVSITDLQIAFNFVVIENTQANKTQIYSPKYFVELYEKNLIETYGYSGISKDYENLKVACNGIIIANKNRFKWISWSRLF